MAKRKFQWPAGGLDVAAKTLVELQMIEVPPEEPPARLREFLDREGYIVRHKLSQAEIATCASIRGKWVVMKAKAMEKLSTRHRAMVLATNKMLGIARSWQRPLPTLAVEVCIYWWHDEEGCEK